MNHLLLMFLRLIVNVWHRIITRSSSQLHHLLQLLLSMQGVIVNVGHMTITWYLSYLHDSLLIML